tara:strand:+ start:1524 stop:2420 length:897 start_codon:yes stop_codon:yes gene_type:complete
MSDEVQTSYSGVTLSQDEANMLMGVEPSQPVEQNLGDSQPEEPVSQETDQSELPESEQEDLQEVEVLELDGQEYDLDTIQEALEAFNNKAEWQKTNTEKSQEISAQRKALEAEQKAWSSLRNNEDAMEALKDILDEDHPLFSMEEGEAVKDTSQDTKDATQGKLLELEERLNEINQVREQEKLDMEADQQVNADLGQLKQTHPELEDQELMDQVIHTAIDKGFVGLQGLEDAFVLTYHTAAEDSAFKTAVNRARSAKAMKSIPEPSGAVKGQHTEPVTKAENYRDARQSALKNYNFYD